MGEKNFTYSRYTWKCTDGDPFVSATVREKITEEKAISMMAYYLRRLGHGVPGFDDTTGHIISEMASRTLSAPTASEAWIERNPPLTEEESVQIINQIKSKCRSNKK